MPTPSLPDLQAVFSAQAGLECAVLVGSRATGRAHAGSDWDIAVLWAPGTSWWDVLGRTETLRRALAQALGVDETLVDVIELRRANLAMRAAAVEEGVVLLGEDTLAWERFLRSTWRALEDFDWERAHAH
ncbi:MAG: type VII toxin-antitoxin system MntA family adenylyltransferase antitoxin [Rhodoferax sp.]